VVQFFVCDVNSSFFHYPVCLRALVLLIECSFLIFVHENLNVFIVSRNLLRLQIQCNVLCVYSLNHFFHLLVVLFRHFPYKFVSLPPYFGAVV